MAIPVYPRKMQWVYTELVEPSHSINTGKVFCFVSADNRFCGYPTTCKDYLHDQVFAHVNKWDATYAGYRFGNSPAITFSRMKLFFTNTGDRILPTRMESQCQPFIHDLETKLGIKPLTRIYSIRNPRKYWLPVGAFLFIGSPLWMRSAPLISLYSLAIRVGCDAIPGASFEETCEEIILRKRQPYYESDRGILLSAIHGVKRLQREGLKKVFSKNLQKEYPTLAKGYTHSAFGIAGFSTGQCRFKPPHWFPEDWVRPC